MKGNWILRFLNTKRPGAAISLEFLLNFLIYIVVFMFLFNVAVIPIKIFYLKCAARDAGILYSQLLHYSGSNDLYDQAKYIMGDLTNTELNSKTTSVTVGTNKTIPLITIKSGETYYKDSVAKVVSYYVTRNLFRDGSLSSKFFDPAKLTIKIDDEEEKPGILARFKEFFQRVFYSFGLTVTVEYPITIFRAIDLTKLIGENFTIKATFYLKFNE